MKSYLDDFLSRPPENKGNIIPPDFDPEKYYAKRWRYVDVDGVSIRYLHFDKKKEDRNV